MSVIGETLKEARIKKAVSLEEIHAKIKIHPRILRLLEEEKFDKLPSPFFTKSFLKSYAEFLGVDAQALLENYEKDKQAAIEPEQLLYLKPADSSGERQTSVLRWAAGVAAALFIAAILFGSPAKILSSLPAKTKKISVTKQEKKRSNPAPVQEKLGAEWLNHAKLGNFPNLNKHAPLDLEIKALDAVWLHITSDGKIVYQGIMKQGAVESWSAKDSIEIWSGNASNMFLSINKKPIGSPGKGSVKKMILSHEGVRIAPAKSGPLTNI
jgi:cytoskeleton protein RodZ